MGELLHISDVVLSYISGDWGEEVNTDGSLVEVACVRGADINNLKAGIFDQLPIRYIKESSLRKNGLQVGNIIIEKSGGSPTQSTGRVAYVSRESLENRENIVCSNFCAAFSIKPEWDSQYIFYYLQYFYNTGVFFNFEGKTSGLHNLQIEQAFKAIPIKKIPLPEQKRIASVLSALDKKIALNRQINQNLEALARQLYDYWFLQFDFPNEEGKPYKSSGGKMVYNPILKREIPEGWEVKEMEEIIDIKSGFPFQSTTYLSKGKYSIITIKNVQDGFLDLSGTDFLDELPPRIPDYCILKRGDILISLTGNIGRVGRVFSDNLLLNQRVGYVDCKNQYNNWAYLYITSSQVRLQIEKLGIGSAQLNVSPIQIGKIKLALPTDQVLSSFDKKLAAILEHILANSDEIASLTKQRDELLPLLMNGQVNFDLSDD